MQPAAPMTYTYPPSDTPALSVNPPSARAGRDVMVEIQGINTSFVDGQTVVGFGTPDVVTRRAADVDAIYSDIDADRVRAVLDRYRVEYVYVGALERIYYPPEGLEKFPSHPERWPRIFQNAEVSIYRVRR